MCSVHFVFIYFVVVVTFVQQKESNISTRTRSVENWRSSLMSNNLALSRPIIPYSLPDTHTWPRFCFRTCESRWRVLQWDYSDG